MEESSDCDNRTSKMQMKKWAKQNIYSRLSALMRWMQQIEKKVPKQVFDSHDNNYARWFCCAHIHYLSAP